MDDQGAITTRCFPPNVRSMHIAILREVQSVILQQRIGTATLRFGKERVVWCTNQEGFFGTPVAVEPNILSFGTFRMRAGLATFGGLGQLECWPDISALACVRPLFLV